MEKGEDQGATIENLLEGLANVMRESDTAARAALNEEPATVDSPKGWVKLDQQDPRPAEGAVSVVAATEGHVRSGATMASAGRLQGGGNRSTSSVHATGTKG